MNTGIVQVLSQLQAAPAGHQEAGPVVTAAGAGGPPETLLLQPLHEGQAGLARRFSPQVCTCTQIGKAFTPWRCILSALLQSTLWVSLPKI